MYLDIFMKLQTHSLLKSCFYHKETSLHLFIQPLSTAKPNLKKLGSSLKIMLLNSKQCKYQIKIFTMQRNIVLYIFHKYVKHIFLRKNITQIGLKIRAIFPRQLFQRRSLFCIEKLSYRLGTSLSFDPTFVLFFIRFWFCFTINRTKRRLLMLVCLIEIVNVYIVLHRTNLNWDKLFCRK